MFNIVPRLREKEWEKHFRAEIGHLCNVNILEHHCMSGNDSTNLCASEVLTNSTSLCKELQSCFQSAS